MMMKKGSRMAMPGSAFLGRWNCMTPYYRHHPATNCLGGFSIFGREHEHSPAGIDADVVLALYLKNEVRTFHYPIARSFELNRNRIDVQPDTSLRNQLV